MVNCSLAENNHRDTENTEIAQRRSCLPQDVAAGCKCLIEFASSKHTSTQQLFSYPVILMTRLARYIEVSANVAIIVVAVLVALTLGKRYLFPPAPAPAPNEIVAGTTVSVPNFDWSRSNRTLMLVLQKDCRYCTESAAFYRTLVSTAPGKATRLLAVLPQEESVAREYLKSLDVQIGEVRQSSLRSLRVRGTPTLILVDSSGKVIKSWIGKLPDAVEKEVLSSL